MLKLLFSWPKHLMHIKYMIIFHAEALMLEAVKQQLQPLFFLSWAILFALLEISGVVPGAGCSL